MANLATIPDNKALTIAYSQSQLFGSMPTVKLVPKNPDGSIFDCTGYNTGNLAYQAPKPSDPTGAQSGTFTVSAADATGITLSFNTTAATSYATTMTTNSSPMQINVSDGTNQILACNGTLNLKSLP